MGKKRNKAGKGEKRRRRNRQPLAGDRYFRQLQSRKPKGTGDVFPQELMKILNDEPELNAEELRLRAFKRAKEAREKGD